MTVALASAADARYGDWLLNLVGSVHANANVFDRLCLFDLGLTTTQRRRLTAAKGVEVQRVPPFVPHWLQGRTWKTWIWTHLDADVILWLDAGVSVLRAINGPLNEIERSGYFVVSTGRRVAESVPSDYYRRFGFDESRADGYAVTAGILGFGTKSAFFDDVITPTYEAARSGFSLGFSAGEEQKYAVGIDTLDEPITRDCPLFRHEQTLLNIFLYRSLMRPHVNDLYKYGGWTSRRDHPEQVFWNHRRRGDLAYLPRVRYHMRYALIGRVWGTWHRWWWWARNRTWLFRPQTYLSWSRRAVLRTFQLRPKRPE